MIDFDKFARFRGFQMQIVCRIPEWVDIFDVPQGEIERQLALAHGWADNNPKKAPKTNMMRYLYNWLLIAQRKGSLLKKPRENWSEEKTSDEMSFEEMREIRRRNMG